MCDIVLRSMTALLTLDLQFDPVKYKRNDENKAYVNKTVRYPNLSDAEQQKKVLYTFAEWFQDPSYRPESDSRDLVNPFRNVRERVAYLLLSYKDYAAMSHNKYSPETWNQDKYYGVYDPAKKPPITANAEIWASMEGIFWFTSITGLGQIIQ